MTSSVGSFPAAVELRQRHARATANPIVSNKQDVTLEFTTAKLGIRVRSALEEEQEGDIKRGLYVATVTKEAPSFAQENVENGSQIIAVNGFNLEQMPFEEAVQHFAQLNLPIVVQFRPPLYPQKSSKKSNHRRHDHDHHGHGHHDHDHDHDHHHECSDSEEDDSSCMVACLMILFVITFLFVISICLNGFPGLPTEWPSMPRLFPKRGMRRRRGDKYRVNNAGENINPNAAVRGSDGEGHSQSQSDTKKTKTKSKSKTKTKKSKGKNKKKSKKSKSKSKTNSDDSVVAENPQSSEKLNTIHANKEQRKAMHEMEEQMGGSVNSEELNSIYNIGA